MVRAHYNAGIVLKGKAEKPVYLYVYNEVVEIRDASDLWGMWKQETEYTLRDRLNKETGKIFGVACIGPAGRIWSDMLTSPPSLFTAPPNGAVGL